MLTRGPMLKVVATCVRWSVVEFSLSFRAILFLAMLLPGTASFAIEEGDDSTPKQPVFSATIESETSANVDGSDPSDLYVRLIDLYSTLSAPEKALFNDGDMLPHDGVQVTYESELTFVSEQMAPPLGPETVATPAQSPYSVVLDVRLIDLHGTPSAPEKALFDDGEKLPHDGVQFTFVSEQMAPPSGQEIVATPAPSASAQGPYSVIMELDL